MSNVGNIKKCIGCGFCCIKARCVASQRLYQSAEVCPALKWDGKRHFCDLMFLPGIIGEGYRKELYAGEGCCSNLNSWRTEPLQDRRVSKKTSKEILPKLFQIFLHCLGKEWVSPDVLYLAILAFQRELEKEGLSEEKIGAISKLIVHYLKGNETSFKKDFMGSL